MKDKFNRYCAEVVYPEAEISISSRECNLLFPREDPFKYGTVIYNYNPYDDLNQMAEVVEKLLISTPRYVVTLPAPINIKQAFRDFIVSTMPAREDGEQHN